MQPSKSLKQLKDQIFSVATIKIEKLRECYKGRGCYHFKDKFWEVSISRTNTKITELFKHKEKAKMMRWIREVLGI